MFSYRTEGCIKVRNYNIYTTTARANDRTTRYRTAISFVAIGRRKNAVDRKILI